MSKSEHWVCMDVTIQYDTVSYPPVTEDYRVVTARFVHPLPAPSPLCTRGEWCIISLYIPSEETWRGNYSVLEWIESKQAIYGPFFDPTCWAGAYIIFPKEKYG